jgi:hypothetical protein
VLFHKSGECVLIHVHLEHLMIALNIPLSMQVSNSMLESLDNVLESPAISRAFHQQGFPLRMGDVCRWLRTFEAL